MTFLDTLAATVDLRGMFAEPPKKISYPEPKKITPVPTVPFVQAFANSMRAVGLSISQAISEVEKRHPTDSHGRRKRASI